MITVGLVLSAGGTSGAAYHSGVLSGLFEATGWDPRTADLIVGTSAGASTAVGLRAGLSATDHAAYYSNEELSPEGQMIRGRVVTPLSLPKSPPPHRSLWPASPYLILQGVLGRGRPRPVVSLAGMLPEGQGDASSLSARINESHPDPWPNMSTWICSVDFDSGKRVIFGRDDVECDVGTAVQASSSIPGYFRPVELNGVRYVDGGIHSSTNADLVAPLGLDVVVISSAMTAVPSESSWPGGPIGRAWHSRTLRREVERIRSYGTSVLVFQPTSEDLRVRGEDNMSVDNPEEICQMAKTSTLAHLSNPHALKSRKILERSINQSMQ
tara:strand:+ start:3189 stop:4166 length:978 start_codon:yes stop_codon:yes gene_type:complete